MIASVKYWWLKNEGMVKLRLIFIGIILFGIIPWLVGVITIIIFGIKFIF